VVNGTCKSIDIAKAGGLTAAGLALCISKKLFRKVELCGQDCLRGKLIMT
jgi:hypothetical protein